MKWLLLYIDDQPQNIDSLKLLLADKFEVIGSSDPAKYDHLLTTHKPHAILLDVHMPQMDGYCLYTKIIEHPNFNDCPIIFISGDLSDENRIRSHSSGGVDFFNRDMRPDELVLRLLSRVKHFQQNAIRLSVGNLTMDFEALKVFIDGKSVELTLLEMRILGALLRIHPGLIIKAEVIKKVWGEENVKPGTLNTHFSLIKPKLRAWDFEFKSKEDRIILCLKED